jgi:hypothetical protein
MANVSNAALKVLACFSKDVPYSCPRFDEYVANLNKRDGLHPGVAVSAEDCMELFSAFAEDCKTAKRHAARSLGVRMRLVHLALVLAALGGVATLNELSYALTEQLFELSSMHYGN